MKKSITQDQKENDEYRNIYRTSKMKSVKFCLTQDSVNLDTRSCLSNEGAM